MSETSGEIYINQWIGAFIYWALKGFKGKYSEQLTEQYLTRNVWTSYTVQIIIAGLILYSAIKRVSLLDNAVT